LNPGEKVILSNPGYACYPNFIRFADGLLLGGVFTLAYAVGRGFMADDKFRFVAVSVSLVIALVTGYLKFVRPLEKDGTPAAG
jgi:hypothetical protein